MMVQMAPVHFSRILTLIVRIKLITIIYGNSSSRLISKSMSCKEDKEDILEKMVPADQTAALSCNLGYHMTYTMSLFHPKAMELAKRTSKNAVTKHKKASRLTLTSKQEHLA